MRKSPFIFLSDSSGIDHWTSSRRGPLCSVDHTVREREITDLDRRKMTIRFRAFTGLRSFLHCGRQMAPLCEVWQSKTFNRINLPLCLNSYEKSKNDVMPNEWRVLYLHGGGRRRRLILDPSLSSSFLFRVNSLDFLRILSCHWKRNAPFSLCLTRRRRETSKKNPRSTKRSIISPFEHATRYRRYFALFGKLREQHQGENKNGIFGDKPLGSSYDFSVFFYLNG